MVEQSIEQNQIMIELSTKQFTLRMGFFAICFHLFSFIFTLMASIEYGFSEFLFYLLGTLITLFLTSIIYYLRWKPDDTSYIPWKRYLMILIALIAIVSIFSWQNFFDFPNIYYFFFFVMPAISSFWGWFLISLALPKAFIIFDPDTNHLFSVHDYRTKITRDILPLNQLSHVLVSLNNWRSDIAISFYNQSNTSILGTPIATWSWSKLLNPAPYFLRLIDLLIKYPITIKVEGFLLLGLFKHPFKIHRGVTEIDVRQHDPVLLVQKAIENKESETKNIDLQSKKRAPTELSEHLRASYDISFEDSSWIFRAKRRGTTSLFTRLLMFATFLMVSIILLLDVILGIELFFDIIIIGNDKPELWYYIGSSGIFILLFALAAWLLLNTVVGRKIFKLDNEFLTYTVNAFGKPLFARNIPMKALVDVEIQKKAIKFRILGGDTLLFWQGPVNNQMLVLEDLKEIFRLVSEKKG